MTWNELSYRAPLATALGYRARCHDSRYNRGWTKRWRFHCERLPTLEPINRILGCIENRKPYAQLYAIIQKYLADHPEEWHDRMAQLAVDALYQGACP